MKYFVTSKEPDFPHSIHDTMKGAVACAVKDGAWHGGSAGVEIRTYDLIQVVPCSDYVDPNFPQERFSLEKGMMVAPST